MGARCRRSAERRAVAEGNLQSCGAPGDASDDAHGSSRARCAANDVHAVRESRRADAPRSTRSTRVYSACSASKGPAPRAVASLIVGGDVGEREGVEEPVEKVAGGCDPHA